MDNESKKKEYFVLNEGQSDMVVGAFFFLFSLALLFIMIPATIKDTGLPFPNPRSLPQVYGWILLVFSVIEFFNGFRKFKKNKIDNDKEVTFKKKGIPQALLCFGILVVSVVLLHWLPYLPVTIVTVFALMYVIGCRKWIPMSIVSVVLPIAVYYFFTLGLKLVLP